MPRFTLDYDFDFDRVLSDLVKDTGEKTRSKAVRHAVTTCSYLVKRQKQGSKIVLMTPGEPNEEVKFV